MKTAAAPAPFHYPVRRAYFRRKLAIEIILQDAVFARKSAAYAPDETTRKYWRKEMRYQARAALEAVRRYIRNEATNEYPELF